MTYLSYSSGLGGPFILDDIDNLAPLNQFGGVTDLKSFLYFVFGNTSGSLGRPISMVSFLLNDQYYPGDPSNYKHTNILVHIITGLLIYVFIRKLMLISDKNENNANIIGLVVTAIWMLHPFNVSTVLYVIQRMTQLMAMFTLAGLVCYLYGREKILQHTKPGLLLITLSLFPFGLLGTFSKENGFLIILYILIIEFFVYGNAAKPKYLKYWFIFFIYTPLVGFISYVILYWGKVTSAYSHREFTLVERLLSESRILCEYIFRTIFPNPGGSGVFHDDYVISKSLFSPITTLTSVIFLFLLVYLAIKIRNRYSLISLAIIWFFVGHLLESTFIPLELYFEHRNYLPMIGILWAAALGIQVLVKKYYREGKYRKALPALPGICVFIVALFTHQSSSIWGSPHRFLAVSAYEHPESLRAQSIYARYLDKKGAHAKAVEILSHTHSRHKQDIALVLAIFTISCQNNFSQPFSFDQIISSVKQSSYSGHFTSILHNFIKTTLKHSCYGYTSDDLHKVLHALEETDGLQSTVLIDLLLVHSDIYVADGNLNMAMETLNKAFSKKPLSLIAARQAQLLASAGLYDDALVFLEKAKKADNRRKFLLPSQITYYNKFEKEIRTMKERDPILNEQI